MAKFEPGDIVSYKAETIDGLDVQFKEKWGTGPFIYLEPYSPMDSKNTSCYLTTMDGKRLTTPCNTFWNHTENNLELNLFLTAARRAITNAKDADPKV